MAPGSVSQLILSDAIAFRVSFESQISARQPALLARAGAVGLRRLYVDRAARALPVQREYQALGDPSNTR